MQNKNSKNAERKFKLLSISSQSNLTKTQSSVEMCRQQKPRLYNL